LQAAGTCVLLVLAFAGVASAQSSSGPDPAGAVSASIRPGDVVRVRIWREPDLSGEFTVDETGTVVLPKLGAWTITGESAGALRADLVRAYEKFLSHSAVEVTVLRRLLVLGAVRNPGLYTVDQTMTVDDGLALAGGATPLGSPNRVELLRHGQKLPVRLTLRTQLGDPSIRSGDQLYVPERSWINRNPGVFVGIVSAVATTLVLALRR
jgi:polysaccharide export outer membrane protein